MSDIDEPFVKKWMKQNIFYENLSDRDKPLFQKARTVAAKRTLRQFFQKNREKIRLLFLKTVCDNAGTCLAFGKYSDKIRQVFDFARFQNVEYMEKINQGKNGFINQLHYKIGNYQSNTILKSSLHPGSDNLAYEYIVGLFLNDIGRSLPCFIETYGLYQYNIQHTENGKNVYQHLLDIPKSQKVVGMDYKKLLSPLSYKGVQDGSFFENSCQNSKYICLLTQHLDQSKSFETYLQDSTFIQSELDIVAILYQIYFSLSQLRGRFTHYDLHAGNVLLFQPTQGYITYHFHFQGGQQGIIKSRYLVKIIDYGRCYYKQDDTNHSAHVQKQICHYNDVCGGEAVSNDCGGTTGYGFLNNIGMFHTWIVSSQYNPSHDMRLLVNIVQHLTYNKLGNLLSQPLQTLLSLVEYRDVYGTPSKSENPLDRQRLYEIYVQNKIPSTKIIHTVHDVKQHLEFLIQELYLQKFQQYGVGETKAGDLHIYENGDKMVFEPFVSIAKKQEAAKKVLDQKTRNMAKTQKMRELVKQNFGRLGRRLTEKEVRDIEQQGKQSPQKSRKRRVV